MSAENDTRKSARRIFMETLVREMFATRYPLHPAAVPKESAREITYPTDAEDPTGIIGELLYFGLEGRQSALMQKALGSLRALYMPRPDFLPTYRQTSRRMAMNFRRAEVLAVLRYLHPELFGSEQMFRDVIGNIIRTPGDENAVETPLYTNYGFLPETVNHNISVLFHTVCEIIGMCKEEIGAEDYQTAYDVTLWILDPEYGKAPEITKHLSITLNNILSWEFSPASAYAQHFMADFFNADPETPADSLLDRNVPGKDISYRHAAHIHILNFKARHMNSLPAEIATDLPELIAFHISTLIILKDTLPGIFIRAEDGKDIFPAIMRDIMNKTMIKGGLRAHSNELHANSDFIYGGGTLEDLGRDGLNVFLFAIAHEIGHNIFYDSKNLPWGIQYQAWVQSLLEVFADICALTFLQKIGYDISNPMNLPSLRRKMIVSSPDGIEYENEYEFSTNQLLKIARSPILNADMGAALTDLMDIMDKSDFTVMPRLLPSGSENSAGYPLMLVDPATVFLETAA